jgi:hypothetical protein
LYEERVKTNILPTHYSPVQGSSLARTLRISCALVLLLAGPLVAAVPPLVSVTASPPVVNREILQSAQFTITLSAPAPRDIGVVFYMSGTARFGFDYTLGGNFTRSGEIVILAGQTSATVTLHPRLQDARFPRENALMNLVHDTRSVHTYRLGSPTRANVILEVE